MAERHGGVIINADSMQVYAELRILSARPDAAEETRAPHRLYGHVPASRRYSVAAWRRDAEAALKAAWGAGQLPIIVGGTGLYFKALTEGIADVPSVPQEIRARVELWAEREGVPTLHAALAERDAEGAALLKPSDRTRVVRALEVLEATGSPLRHFQARLTEPPLIEPDQAHRLVLDPERALLYARIGERFDRMVEAGALDEVRALSALGLDPALPAMKAIGVREFSAFLAGEITLPEAIERAKMETRRYAKRQVTWFRHQMADWTRIVPGDDPGLLLPG